MSYTSASEGSRSVFRRPRDLGGRGPKYTTNRLILPHKGGFTLRGGAENLGPPPLSPIGVQKGSALIWGNQQTKDY